MQLASEYARNSSIHRRSDETGTSPADTKSQMDTFIFLSPEEQKAKYFGSDGVAVSAAESLGLMFKKPGAWNVDQKIAKVITGEYLD